MNNLRIHTNEYKASVGRVISKAALDGDYDTVKVGTRIVDVIARIEDDLKGPESDEPSTERAERYAKYAILVEGQVLFEGLGKNQTARRLLTEMVRAGASPKRLHKINRSALGEFRGELDLEGILKQIEEDRVSGLRKWDRYRFFLEDDDIMHEGGMTYAPSTQWAGNMCEQLGPFLRAYPELGFEVREL